MYQALYRKYRPTTLKDVNGQDIIVKTLTNAVINNKLSHAYLFCGPRGTGKTSIAKIIGKMANCEKLENGNPCNICVNCTQINNGESVDLIEIDAASNNGVDEIREIKSKVNLVPNTGKYKIYIIDEVHMLTVGAFNALLKTLEEPPSHIIFILATTEPHKIPATILSRCQRYDFKKISVNSIVDRLKFITEKENIFHEDGVLEEIARLSDGGMRDSISLLDQAVSYSDDVISIKDVHNMNGTISQLELKNFISYIINNDFKNLFQTIDKYNDDGKNLIKLSDEIIYFLRNVLLFKIVPDHFSKLESDIYEEIENKISKNDLINMIDNFNSSINKMKNSSNPKIILETTIIFLLKEKENSNEDSKIQSKRDNILIETDNKILSHEEKKEEEKKDKNENKPLNIKEKFNDENLNKFHRLEEIRINNTLSKFNKKELVNLNEKFELFRNKILTSDFGEVVSLILEGKIRAASEDHVIMVFEETWLKNKFNKSIIEIESLFKEVYNKTYKVVATDINTWEIYKRDFNNKLRKFEWIEEPSSDNFLNNEEEKTEIENIFNNIVEYK